MTETRVVKIVSAPEKFITCIGGVPTEERAKLWGEKMGFVLVYWVRRLQRAYGAKKEEREK